MATALDLITSSLRLINVMASGEQVPLDMANESLAVLNDMIDSWNTDRLSIYTTRTDDFPFVLGQQEYTLGAGGDFDIARPARIDAMSVILLTNPAVPVELPINMYSVEEWQTQVPVKNVPGSIPQICYDDGGFPLRTLSFWPIPAEQLNSCRIYSWQALPAQALAAQVAFPPGYRQAFRYNLAVLLAAEYATPVPAVVAQVAVDSLAKVKTMNAPDLMLQSDLLPAPAGYNYQADMFGLAYRGPL
jgi:hypothetical protein